MPDRSDSSPFKALFDAQKDLIENGQRFFESTARLPLDLNEAMYDTLSEQWEAQAEALELGRTALLDVIETMETTTGEEGTFTSAREAVEESFDALLEQHEELIAAVDDQYEETIADLDESIEEFTDQGELLLELNETLEAQTQETFEGLEEQLTALQETIEEQLGTLDEELPTEETEDVDEQVEQYEAQIKEIQDRFQEIQTQLEDAVEEADDEE